MSALQYIQGLSGIARIRSADSAPTGLKPYAPVDTTSQSDALRARTRLLRLYAHLEKLAELANIETRFKLDLPDAQSRDSLGLDLTHTAATLDSSAEINASPMSFSPFGPAWDGASSALFTVGGEYDGTHGSGDITIEVRRAGTRGDDDLRFRVYDPSGGQIRNFNVRTWHDEDRTYDLRNGLFVTLGPGSVINRDTTTIQVFDSVGAAVNPDLPLGGVRNNNPNLQFDSPTIADGAFDLNGQSISVATTDTINDVINRINLSAAGVTASFNAGTESIDFLQDTLGAAPTIDLQNDTSNFLAATKLDSANTIAGIDPETIQALDDVAAFGSVSSGNILINGQQIAVDTSSDSLESVIDKINTAPAGVIASFDSVTQKVLIEAEDSASRLEIDSNGTGFFAAIDMPDGRVDPEAITRGISRKRSYDIANSLETVFSDLNYLFRDSSFLGRGRNVGAYRAPLESAISTAFSGSAAEGLGYLFDSTTAARQRGDYVGIDRRDFTTNLQIRGDSVMDILRGDGDAAGLIEGLLIGTTQALRGISSSLGQRGVFVNTIA
jgi:sulfur carrier protein ThiS